MPFIGLFDETAFLKQRFVYHFWELDVKRYLVETAQSIDSYLQ